MRRWWWWWWHVPICGVVTRQCDGACNKTPIKMWAELLDETETQRSPHPGRWRPSQCHLPPCPALPWPAYDTLTRSPLPAAPQLRVITGHQGLTWFRLTRVRTRVFSIILTSFLVFILNGIQKQMNGNSKKTGLIWFTLTNIHQSIMIVENRNWKG